MEIKIDVPKYSPTGGIKYQWEGDSEIETKVVNGIMVILANKGGLLSLANHLLNLAQEEIPVGYNMHFAEDNSLEPGSTDLIIQKVPTK